MRQVARALFLASVLLLLFAASASASTESLFQSWTLKEFFEVKESKKTSSRYATPRSGRTSSKEQVAENEPGWRGGVTNPMEPWVDIAAGEGRYVAMTRKGLIGTSTNGEKWQVVYGGGERAKWESIAYGGGNFVAVAFGGKEALFSPDGLQWESISGKLGSWSDVVWGNGQFVAVSGQGGIQASRDGQNWSYRLGDTGSKGRPSWRGVSWDGENFYAVAYRGDKRFATSSNGWDWKEMEVPEEDYSAVASGGGRVVAGTYDGRLLLSSNQGESWEEVGSVSASVKDILYANGKFFVTWGWNKILVSSDGLSWTEEELPRAYIKSLAMGEAGIVGVGSYIWETPMEGAREGKAGFYVVGCCEGAPAEETITEAMPAGVEWRVSDTGFLARDLAWGAGQFVGVGRDGQVRSSEDGEIWQASEEDGQMSFITFAENKFVTVAFGGQDSFSSPDGLSWTRSSLADARGDRPGSTSGWADLAYGGGLFATVSTGGGIQTSEDGIHWVRNVASGKLGSPTLRGVAWGAGRFVVVGESGQPAGYVSAGNSFAKKKRTAKKSPRGTKRQARSGLRWQETELPAGRWQDVAWGAGRFVAVSYDGQIMTSENGTDWQVVYQNELLPMTSVDFLNNQFVVSTSHRLHVPDEDPTKKFYLTRMLVSYDGSEWYPRDMEIDSSPLLAWGADRFVALSSHREQGQAAVSGP